MKNSVELFFENRLLFRNWLKINHNISNGIWLIYYKKHTGNQSIIYNEAVDESLCFGWIDSTVKKIDEEKYKQKFTPRSDKSEWSELNKSRVEKLIQQKKMTKYGLKKIEAAKKNGMWNKLSSGDNKYKMPEEFKEKLRSNKEAAINFENLPPSYKQNYIRWIASAKRDETKKKRIKKALELLNENKKLGMV